MEAKTRYYLNITTKCNTECDFCCMYSSPNKNRFLPFNTFKNIIDDCPSELEVQLEGGEPFLNQDLYLFCEYLRSTNKCNKIIISTNGIILNKHLQRLTDFISSSNIKILIKRSINNHLYSINNNIFKECRDLYLATEFIDNIEIRFNVRLRNNNLDKYIIDKLYEYKIYNYSYIYELQNYGKVNDNSYKQPIIVQNIDNWSIYASDGKCFEHDLISRSEYEKKLN